MQITKDLLKPIIHRRADERNVDSVVIALNQYGSHPAIALDQPHRLAQFLSQIAHESGRFVYDEEVWGPTEAQARYDTRTDLGNTPERDGDGFKFRGRTAMQLTGRYNYIQFRDWCRSLGLNPPDFEKDPDAVNTDPWEGLVPIWYWTSRKLNRYADENDIELITKRINGGLNGYPDRLRMYSIIGMGMLGYPYTEDGLRQLQTHYKARGWYTRTVDGEDGPGTRAAIHKALVHMGTIPASQTKPSPVTEPTPVAPENGEKTALNRGMGILTVLGAPFAAFAEMDTAGKLIVVGVVMVAGFILFSRGELIARRIKAIRKSFERA